jgi:predicted  nucleic acid-binding Zn-ribbon protein
MEKKDGEAMEARLAEMGKRIDELKSKLGTVTGEVKAELERRIDAAYAGQEEQRQRLQQLKDKGLEQWDTLKDSAGKAWNGLEKSLQDLASRFKK